MSNNDAFNSHESFFSKVTRGASAFVGILTENEQYCIIGQAEPGELLEFQQGGNIHYALYLGDGKVMSVDVKDEKATEAFIREHTLREVCKNEKVCVKNLEDVAETEFGMKARSAKEIVQAAMFFKNEVVPYEWDFRNSEYYCTLWRYGRGFSTQAAEQATVRANFFEGDGYAKYKQLDLK